MQQNEPNPAPDPARDPARRKGHTNTIEVMVMTSANRSERGLELREHMTNRVLVKDIPPTLIADVQERILPYTVAFLRRRPRSAPGPAADLLGSGVLVTVGSTHAILTADHVREILPRDDRVCVFLEPTAQPHTIDNIALAPIPIARGANDREGPDLAAIVILAPHVAASIAAKKSFYPLDRLKSEMLNSPPPLDSGFWLAQGFVNERTTVRLDDDGGTTTLFYNWGGVGGPDAIIEHGGYDYFDFPADSRDQAPESWGGMSGGPLWQVEVRRDDNGQLSHKRTILSGVLFYQHPTTPTQCGVRAHGRTSVYVAAYEAIRSAIGKERV